MGVIPNFETSAEEAYELGLTKAREAAEQRREAKIKRAEAYIVEYDEALTKVTAKLAAGDEPGALAILSASVKAGFERELLNEAMVNQLGYQMSGQGKRVIAQALMQANVDAFPNNPNVYDSMGDVHDQAGNSAEAMKFYTKAVELGKAQGAGALDAYEANLARIKAKIK